MIYEEIYTFLGCNIINLKKTWEHLVLAARILAGIENPEDICVVSSNPHATVIILIKNKFYKRELYLNLVFLLVQQQLLDVIHLVI